MTITNIVVALLATGLVIAFLVLRSLRRRAREGRGINPGIVGICSALMGVLPAILIKIDIIEQTGTTVALAIAYLLLFLIGSMLVNSAAFQEAGQRSDK